jgi:hypothetical protein
VIAARPAGRASKGVSDKFGGRRTTRPWWFHPFAWPPGAFDRTALNRGLRVSDSAINIGMDAVLPAPCRLINQLFTGCRLDPGSF